MNWDYKHRADNVIAHGALTNSKRPESFVFGVYPTHIEKSVGAYAYDSTGKRYIDFICSLGSVLIGHASRPINEKIVEQLTKGSIHSLSSTLEVHYAERLKALFPVLERMRFLKSGSEACSAAIRIARAYTGRQKVFSEGYHGWHDDYVSLTPPANGVPARSWMQSLTPHSDLSEAAAVILEPISTDNSLERLSYLRALRDRCKNAGALFIADEVITMLRFPQGCASKYYGLEPDLLVGGKALGGGLPLNVVGGPKSIMECDYFVSSTFAGDQLAFAASLELLNMLTNTHNLERFFNTANWFQEQFNMICRGVVQLEGYGTRSRLIGDPVAKALLMQEACKAGVLLGPSFFASFANMELKDEVLSLIKAIITRIKTGQVSLQGELPKTPFAQKVREQ